MGWWSERSKRKEEPVTRFVKALEASGAPELLQIKSEELNGRTQTGTSGSLLAWQELSWDKQHSSERAKRLRVEASAAGVNVSVSRLAGGFSNPEIYYKGSKPFMSLTLKEKIEIGTRIAEHILPPSASNSVSAQV